MVTRIAALFLVLVCCGCGDAKGPNANAPWTGQVGNLLVSETATDQNDIREKFWVGFDSQSAWTQAKSNLQQSPSGVIVLGGTVHPSSDTESSFYFEPATTVSAQILAPEWVVSIDQIKAAPQQYATTRADAAFPNGTWFVLVHVDQIVEHQ